MPKQAEFTYLRKNNYNAMKRRSMNVAEYNTLFFWQIKCDYTIALWILGKCIPWFSLTLAYNNLGKAFQQRKNV